MTAALAPILDLAALRALESRHAADALMERAGMAAAQVAARLAGDRARPVVVLAGPGNNGGDAFVVARHLAASWHDVHVVFVGSADRLPPDAATAFHAFTASGGQVTPDVPATRPGLVIDGLLGIGISRAPEGRIAKLVAWTHAAAAPVLALDVPTGLDAATGRAHAPTVRATHTATFIALKPGLVTLDGPDHCGEISVHDLGLAGIEASGRLLAWDGLAACLPAVLARRVHNVNKGSFGTLGLLGGTDGMAGALVLAGRAAMRAGAGKAWLGFLMKDPPPLDTGMPELMLRHADAVLEAQPDALVVGPGLGTSDAAHALVARALDAAIPLALDADALNLLARDPSLLAATRARRTPTLVTPHPGEAARLLATTVEAVQADRLAAAHELARRLSAHVVLKGAGSVLAHPDGSFDINASGGPALSSAGSGDVLSGVLGALLAQQLDPCTALRYAACLHGAAADALVAQGIGPLGLTASELPDAMRALLNLAGRRTRVGA